ncbi:bifunctional ADP-dependent NAD(P)H-hydrate dehydratase/NAD(P)H-hydrate epimerase [Micropruina sp.]|uniref:bifunctional ADP-dependent NAD(P)H-hydrate dehydratase/NAD(P)H-hydrate epimerase n=1 Tax=Micropruina sp. TaxID=2737536 RepID=UPI0039E38E47
MRPVYLAETIRAAEAPLLEALPGVLMQRAATALASVLLRELRAVRGAVYGARVLLVVGSGNNGGDALYAGARLSGRGVRVAAWRTSQRVHESAWAAFRAAGGRELDAVGAVAGLSAVDLVVDGVLGIGGRAGLREPVALFARACVDAGVPVVAVDLPSGLAADSPALVERVETRASLVERVETRVSTSSTGGGGVSHFAAARTVTFGGLKFCQVLQPAASGCGVVEVVDIGLDLPEPDLRCWEPSDVAAAWPWPGVTSDKYSRGVVGLDTGSDAYPGAAVLSTLGAVQAGAGMVRFAGAAGAAGLVGRAAPNVVFGAGRVQARVLGSGWGDRADGAAVVERALAEGIPLVLDADALRFLPATALGEQVLLTPHAGELAKLLGIDRAAVASDPICAVRRAAKWFGATVLLKGATQYVCGPDGGVSIAVPGPHWTAQAGSGDVLAGICGTLLAAGLPPAKAALAGASIQALTAAAAPGPYPPQQLVVERLPGVIAGLRPPLPG